MTFDDLSPEAKLRIETLALQMAEQILMRATHMADTISMVSNLQLAQIQKRVHDQVEPKY